MSTIVRDFDDKCTVLFFSSRRRHTRLQGDWSSDVCSSDLDGGGRGRRFFGRLEQLGDHLRLALVCARDLFIVGVVAFVLVGRSEERRVGKEYGTKGVM